jgi:3-dehydroquinate synthase
MDNLSLNLITGNTDIIFGNYSEKLKLISKNRQIIIICDSNINRLFPEISKKYISINITAFESEKTLQNVEFIYSQLLELKTDKSTLLVAIGGGIICDIAGYVAATFYRGLSVVLIPTTLLAMVDASIGGKNGVNFNNHKNIIGTISQPETIIIDTNFLKTLPHEEFKNGIAEIIKHSIISGGEFYNSISKNNDLKSGIISETAIKSAIKIKLEKVSADVNEKNIRKVLNFGHTLGHIIELKQGISHGKAIAIGMLMATKISAYFNKCDNKLVDEIENLISFYELPVDTSVNIDKIIESLEFDKKKNNETLHFVFIENIGTVKQESISIENLKKCLLALFN